MQVAVESLGSLQRKMTVRLSPDTVDKQVDIQLEERARTAKIKGFRPGKAPLDMIKRQFGEAIRQEVLGEVIRRSFYDALEQQKLNMAGMPRIEPKSLESGAAELVYEAIFEVFPEIQLQDLAGVPIEKWRVDVTEADLEKVLNKLQEQHAKWQEIAAPAELKDRLVVDFEGFINGQPIEQGSAKNVTIVLGSKTMIPGFEDGLLGAKAGEKRELSVTFPENYPHQPLAGKAANFNVTVHRVERPELPELNDEFATRLDVEGGIAGLRNEVMKSMEREVAQRVKEHTKQQVLKLLVERNSIDIPEALINAEIDLLQEQMRERLGLNKNKSRPAPELPRDIFEEQAKQRVKVGLLLSEYIKQQQLKASPERIRSLIEEITAGFDNPNEAINYYYQSKQLMSRIEAMVLEEEAVAKLAEQADVKEKVISFDEAVNAQQQE